MATKKAASKSTALVRWDEKFAAQAKKEKDQSATISTGGMGIKFGRGWIEVAGARLKNNALQCVIVGYCGLNAWYEKDYDANDVAPPDCYALGDSWNAADMRPHVQAEKPQSEEGCATCDWNKLGSAKTGRGKACANRVRLGIVLASDLEDTSHAGSAEMATASVSPTNVYKAFKPYLDYVNDELGRPLWSVVTQISAFDDPKQQIRLEFSLVDKIDDDEALTALEKRNDTIQSVLQTPFVQIEKTTMPAKKTVGKSSKFAGKPSGRGK
jgi:hypothetical protein